MRNLLDSIAIEMPCPSCHGTYAVSFHQIQSGHQMLEGGCDVRHFEECPPAWWSRLLSASAVAELVQAVRTLERVARGAGGRLVFRP